MSSKERTSHPTHNRRSQQQSISSNSNTYANKKHQTSVISQQHQQLKQKQHQQLQSQVNQQQSMSMSHLQQQSSNNINIAMQSQVHDSHNHGNNSSSILPEKLDTQKVIEMIRNADLYDLINISLRSSELKNDQVEQFIQRALEKGQQSQGSNHQTRQNNQNSNPLQQQQQLELIFTPPSKIRQGASPNINQKQLHLQSNDENQNILTVENQKKQLNLQTRQHHNRSQQNNQQQPLQPSILQNASSINQQQNYNYIQIDNTKHTFSTNQSQQLQQQQYQGFTDKNLLMEQFLQQLAQRQAQLDQEDSCYDSQAIDNNLMMEEDEYLNQVVPREQIPQPYSDQPTSPTDENLPEGTFQLQNQSQQQQIQQQQSSMHHYRNDSFSDQDFAQQQVDDSQQYYQYQDSSSSRVQEQLHPLQEAGYKGDQFSFQLKMRESMAKRSPGSSNYSTLKDSCQSSQKKQQKKSTNLSLLRSGSKSSTRNYENQLKMQHSLKYQQQLHHEHHQQQQPPQQQLNRTLSNFRAFQHQNTLNRSTSTNCIQNQDKNTTQPTSSNIGVGLSKISSTKNLNQHNNHSMLQKSFIQQTVPTQQINLLDESMNKTPRASKNIMNGSMTQRFSHNNNTQLTPSNRSNMGTAECSDRSSIMTQRKGFEIKKQQLLLSMQQMNIMHIRELERIKKPSQLAYLTSRLVCQFFFLFNVSAQNKQLHMEDLIEWDQIQMHINQQVMKYFNDLIQQIKVKLFSADNFTMNSTQREILEIKLVQLKEQYFTGENLKIFKHLSTNKNMQTIVTFILSVINYFIESKNIVMVADQSMQQRDSSLVLDIQEEQRSFAGMSGVHNQFDALITSRAQQDKRIFNNQSHLELSQTRGKSRNHNLHKIETTPTIIQNQKSTKNEQSQQQQQPSMQKSASRCLLLRRDRSQLIQKDASYQTNKSPMNKTPRDVSFNNKTPSNANVNQGDGESTKNLELSVNRKQQNKYEMTMNSARRNNLISSTNRQKSASRSPLNAHRKININNSLNQTSHIQSTSRIAQRVQEFAQKNQTLLQNLDYNQDLNEEPPIELNYKLMIESSEITTKIRESTAAIEQNMKFLTSPSAKKHIDMSLIEQIKQRRKDQLEREKSEERVSLIHHCMNQNNISKIENSLNQQQQIQEERPADEDKIAKNL